MINQNGNEEIRAILKDPANPILQPFLDVVAKHGTPEEINTKAAESRDLDTLKSRLKAIDSPYLADLAWLEEHRDNGAFVSMEAYLSTISKAPVAPTNTEVTLEISACQYFPWLVDQARRCVENKELMPGRIIRVRNMAESENDNGDLLAMNAAAQIIGATVVETLNTNGVDGSNIHLGGPETLAGYFGGIGMPNDYPLRWLDEYLHYYTNFGTIQALNISPGQLMIGYLLNQIGVDNEFKISVFYSGHDSAYGVFYTLAMAKLMQREDGRSPLIGLNLSNSVNVQTLRDIAAIRAQLGMAETVRIEHHITEAYKSIVRQPYCRRDDLIEVARTVSNIAAKHEGGEPATEATRLHPSDIFDYFISKSDMMTSGLWERARGNYMDKHTSVQLTAKALAENGIGIKGAANLHRALPA